MFDMDWRRRRLRPRLPALNWKRLGLVIGIPAAAGLVVFLLIRFVFAPSGTADRAERSSEPPVIAAVPPPPPPVKEEKIVVPPGASLARILRRQGFDNKEIHRLREGVKSVYDLAKIKAGREMRLTTSTDGGPWKSIEYDIDDTRYLVVRNDPAGVAAEIKYYPFEVKTAYVAGTIEDSLIAAVNAAGEESTLALDLVEGCFGWDIDFFSDLQKGDRFRVVVEKKYLDGKFSGYRNILAAEFVNHGRVYQAYRFTYPDSGASDYFDENGGSKRKEFLRSPFKFTPRITSRFSASRLHPIYRVYRPHYGVDYGAPIGTPVQATADGRVIMAGWEAGGGRTVKIQHKNYYETMYLHLSGFGPGIAAGAQVRGGEVVGYVGSSGDSTGPHLDYRIYDHGRPVNPLGQKFQPADPIRKEFLAPFKEQAAKLKGLLDAPAAFQAAAAALPPAF